MTPPPPKTYFPVAETEPPSKFNSTTLQSPTTHTTPSTPITTSTHPSCPTGISQSPNISIQLTPTITVTITISNHTNVKPQYLATPSTISIAIKTPPPVRTVETQSPQSPLLPPLSVVENMYKTPISTVEIPPSPTRHTILSATAPSFKPTNLHPTQFTPRRPRRPYKKRLARTITVTPECHRPVEISFPSIVYKTRPFSRRKLNRTHSTNRTTPSHPTLVHQASTPQVVSSTTIPTIHHMNYRDALSPDNDMTD